MGYYDKSVTRTDTAGSKRDQNEGYNEEINIAKESRNNQFKDSDPTIEKEGFLGMDDLDKMRRRKIR